MNFTQEAKEVKQQEYSNYVKAANSLNLNKVRYCEFDVLKWIAVGKNIIKYSGNVQSNT